MGRGGVSAGGTLWGGLAASGGQIRKVYQALTAVTASGGWDCEPQCMGVLERPLLPRPLPRAPQHHLLVALLEDLPGHDLACLDDRAMNGDHTCEKIPQGGRRLAAELAMQLPHERLSVGVQSGI